MADAPFVLFDHGPLGDPALFSAPVSVIRADTASEVPAAFEAMQAAQAQGKWLAGMASYELGYVFSSKLQELSAPSPTFIQAKYSFEAGLEAAKEILLGYFKGTVACSRLGN